MVVCHKKRAQNMRPFCIFFKIKKLQFLHFRPAAFQ